MERCIGLRVGFRSILLIKSVIVLMKYINLISISKKKYEYTNVCDVKLYQ